MVVTLRPAAAVIGVMHERTALPSRWTVHAPHWPMPQPNLVPVRPIESRKTQRSGVSAATSTLCDRPLTSTVNEGMGSSSGACLSPSVGACSGDRYARLLRVWLGSLHLGIPSCRG